MPLEERFRLRSWSSSIASPSLAWRTSSIVKTTRGNSRRSSPIALVMSKQLSPKTHPSLMIFGAFFREKFMNFTDNLLLASYLTLFSYPGTEQFPVPVGAVYDRAGFVVQSHGSEPSHLHID